MKRVEVVVQWRAGLHARPAVLLAKTAGKFKSKISLKRGNEIVDVKSVIQVMTLGAKYKSRLLLIVEGRMRK